MSVPVPLVLFMTEQFLRVLLLVLLTLPVTAAITFMVLGEQKARTIRWLSLGTVLVNLFAAVVLAIGLVQIRAERAASGEAIVKKGTFRPEIVPGASKQDPTRTRWRLIDFGRQDLGKGRSRDLGGIEFYLGVDGLNIWLIVLTALLMVSAVLISWESVKERPQEYYAWLVLLGAGMFGVFLAFDIILFYIFFELTLVPLFFLIGIWGGPQRRHAARKFFIYTLAGSVITLLGLLAIVVVCYQRHPENQLTFAIPELIAQVNGHLQNDGSDQWAFWQSFQFWVFLALVAGFAIKVPLVPVHTWLPLAHVEAPTAGSVLLAGVLLKIGSYGFLRLCLPMTPHACLTVGVPLIGILSVIGILYGAFCALAQEDIKKLVAYSSVSHMGFCMLGMFALNLTGLTGSLLQMINHGLSTGALFLLVGMLYDRYHTRNLTDFGGLGAKLGVLTFCMIFICLSSIGLPGLNGFVGEALVFFGMFKVNWPLAIIGTAGIVLGAWYLLNMIRQVFFGEPKEPTHTGSVIRDMNLREWVALGPIMALCLVLGVYPQPAINTATPDLQVIATIMENGQRQLDDAKRRTSEQAQAQRKHNGAGN